MFARGGSLCRPCSSLPHPPSYTVICQGMIHLLLALVKRAKATLQQAKEPSRATGLSACMRMPFHNHVVTAHLSLKTPNLANNPNRTGANDDWYAHSNGNHSRNHNGLDVASCCLLLFCSFLDSSLRRSPPVVARSSPPPESTHTHTKVSMERCGQSGANICS
eukprot:TRINITY_DN6297_c2_g1_i1.p1 TRINITY_DN6297_c2_g1~~TRINITY_DN6297_c2_g1_i1.p1  ORF type:complete len:163 (-),score=1.45 TRINITY_DN6297_c2_g1_i1:363-851(-)